ncbi:putative gamma-glutamylcyclotransferase CG2811 isoform X1 [Tribolium madens]|uniref:putative gamma-glutamylcyclotransferase CG2811 isoform X1 n=1 Tax=Tribolium madens TaxID=41895 RepID=UPI001CF727A5|nr:putative gamma-glutamylcyclotransferase CG2811 isoform X1 [Tribolium madens]
MSRLHKVFVYGTLKRGEPNHNWFEKDSGYYKLISEAKTVEKYPLIIGTKYNIPFLLHSPGNGTNVRGEVYEVDDKVFANLDTLEDHPNFYIREEKDVLLLNSNEKIKTWIYFIKDFKDDLLNKTTYESYSNAGSHGLKYVERYLRGDTYDHKLEILKTVKS